MFLGVDYKNVTDSSPEIPKVTCRRVRPDQIGSTRLFVLSQMSRKMYTVVYTGAVCEYEASDRRECTQRKLSTD